MQQDAPLPYRVRTYGRTSHKLIFVFCPFSIPSWQLALPGLPIWHMVRHGYQVVAYEYGPKIVATPQIALATISTMLEDAQQRLQTVPADVTVYCFGSSMGTVMAANFAARNKRIRKVVLNLAYPDIAEFIVHVPPMVLVPSRHAARFIAQGGGHQGLQQMFADYSPERLVKDLTGKEVLLYLARKDRIHQYRHTKRLPSQLVGAGAKLEYYENSHLNHFLAAFKNHIGARRYMEFLNK